MKQPIKRTVKLADILRDSTGAIDVSLNVRESTKEGYDIAFLVEDIRERGLLTPPSVVKTASGYQILQGNRRILSLEQLGIQEFPALVYEGLSQLEIALLVLDHGNTKPLTKAEVYIACKRGLEFGMKEVTLVKANRPLLEKYWPRAEAQKKNLHTDQDWLESYRGTIQGFKRVFESPEVVEKAYLKKLHGSQRWPSEAEIKDGHKIFMEECRSDPMFNRQEPGPKFTAFWQKVMDAGDAKDNDSTTRPKTASMMTRIAVETLLGQTDCLFMKIAIKKILNDVTEEAYVFANKVGTRLHSEMTQQEKDRLSELLGVKPVTDSKDDSKEPAPETALQEVEGTIAASK